MHDWCTRFLSQGFLPRYHLNSAGHCVWWLCKDMVSRQRVTRSIEYSWAKKFLIRLGLQSMARNCRHVWEVGGLAGCHFLQALLRKSRSMRQWRVVDRTKLLLSFGTFRHQAVMTMTSWLPGSILANNVLAMSILTLNHHNYISYHGLKCM